MTPRVSDVCLQARRSRLSSGQSLETRTISKGTPSLVRLLAGDLQYVRYQIPQRSQKVKSAFLAPRIGSAGRFVLDSGRKDLGRGRQATYPVAGKLSRTT